MYALLGAGTLRAKQYIEYGSEIEQNKTVSTAVTDNVTTPVKITGVTVTNTGTYTVTSTVTTSGGQNCSHSEVDIRPETVFQYGSKVTISAK
jgi:asparagine N-glycosylation enzyme membrane subunit Stt3